MSDRETIRRHATNALRALSDVEHLALSQKLCARLLSLSLLKDARVVGAYWPVRKEANIIPALDALLARGVQVALPVVQGTQFTFASLASTSNEHTKVGAFTIPEPNGPPVAWEDLDVIIVPGRAFDRNGNRLGYGKGFYDRSLFGKDRVAVLVGVALSCQLQSQPILSQSHDIPMDWIVTDEEAIRVREET